VKAKALFPDELFAVLRKSKAIRVRRHRRPSLHRDMVCHGWAPRRGALVERQTTGLVLGAFLREPGGTIRVGKVEVAIRALPISGKRLRDSVDRAYRKKHDAGGELKYAKDLTRERSRATTIEFVTTRA